MNYDDLYRDYIQLSNDWIFNDDNLIQKVGTEGFFLLVNLLQKRTFKNTVCFNKQLVCSFFGGTRKEYSSIAYKALKSLIDNKVFILKQEINFEKPNPYDFYEAEVNFPTTFENKYFTISAAQLNKIMNYKGKESKHKLLAVFCALKCRIFGNEYISQYCKISFQTLENRTTISSKTIEKYVNILQELDLILYGNPGTRSFPDNSVKESPNFYTLAVDEGKETLKAAMQSYRIEEAENNITFITREATKEKIKQNRIISCKKKSADNRLKNGMISQEEHDHIISGLNNQQQHNTKRFPWEEDDDLVNDESLPEEKDNDPEMIPNDKSQSNKLKYTYDENSQTYFDENGNELMPWEIDYEDQDNKTNTGKENDGWGKQYKPQNENFWEDDSWYKKLNIKHNQQKHEDTEWNQMMDEIDKERLGLSS